VKDSVYEQLECVFDKFNVKVGKEDDLKLTIVNEGLHEINNDNGDRGVNFAIYKNFSEKNITFSHCNIHKSTWTSTIGKPHNQIDHILMDMYTSCPITQGSRL
jgi:hypothetical protein